MNSLPTFPYTFEDQRHSTRSCLRCALVSLRLCPQTTHYGAVASEHCDREVANIQLHIFYVGIGAFPIAPHLLPTLCDGPVAIEEYQAWRLQINTRHCFDVRVSDAIDQSVECGDDALRSGRVRRNLWFDLSEPRCRLGSRRLLDVRTLLRVTSFTGS